MVVESRSVTEEMRKTPPPPFPSRARLIFALLVLMFPLYYLRAWHRLTIWQQTNYDNFIQQILAAHILD